MLCEKWCFINCRSRSVFGLGLFLFHCIGNGATVSSYDDTSGDRRSNIIKLQGGTGSALYMIATGTPVSPLLRVISACDLGIPNLAGLGGTEQKRVK